VTGDFEQAFFLHIPKTGGRSFQRVLRHDAGLGAVLRIPPDNGMFGALVKVDGYRVAHGHAPYPVTGVFKQPLLLMTFLRSPVERLVSSFEYVLRSKLAVHDKHRAFLREQGVETLVDMANHGSNANMQTLLLGVDYDIRPLVDGFRRGELTAAEARLEMHRERQGQVGPQALKRAKARLEQFQFVGITEAYDESVRLFAKLIGFGSTPTPYRANRAPERQRAARKQRYDEATLEAVAQANRLDLELYDFAVELFRRRYEDAFDESPPIDAPGVVAPPAVRS
jgi:hypothetical protein